MAASADNIRGWLTRLYGHDEYTHMIVVTDTFDYSDYPRYVTRHEDVRKVADQLRQEGMNRITEVYSRKLTMDEQMREHRAFHYD